MRTDAILPVPNNNNSIDHKSIDPSAKIRSRQDVNLCDLSGDVARHEFRCDTLEEYCAISELSAKNSPLLGDQVTCTGNLNGEYSIRVQGYVCIAPGTSLWLEGIPYEVCYDQFGLVEYSVFEAMPEVYQYGFVEGFSFKLEETRTTCTDNPSRLCTCTIALEGQECNTCELCNDGRIIEGRGHYSYAIDCTNLASDLIRTCNATSWGEFFEQVEASLPFQLPKNNDDKNNSLPSTIPPTNNNNNKSLSVAELGGIIGACVALLLAGVLAVTLWFLLSKGNRRSNNSKNQNDNTSRVDDDRLSSVPPPGTIPPLAQVLMVDHGALLDSNIDPIADASTPRFKDQMRV